MFNLAEYQEPKHRLSDRLPWAALVAPGVVAQKDGVLLRSYSFRGPDLSAAHAGERVSAAARANNQLMRLGSGWTLFFEAARRPAKAYPASHWPTPASRIVDMERRATFGRPGGLHESEYFLSLAWRTPQDTTRRLKSFFYDNPDSEVTLRPLSRDLEHFDKITAETAAALAGVFARIQPLGDDALLTYLKSTISIESHPVRTPEHPMYLDALLPGSAFVPGEISSLGDHYIGIVTIRGFPSSTLVGTLDALNQLQFPYRWMTRFICLGKSEAESQITKLQRNWYSKTQSLRSHITQLFTGERSPLDNPTAVGKVAEATEALRELGNESAAFGYCTTALVTWSRDARDLENQVREIKQRIEGRGFVAVAETLNVMDAWLGTVPGHVHANVRRPLIHTQNLTHIMPLSAVWPGESVNAHLKAKTGLGRPHMYCAAGGSPFALNLHQDDVSNTLIVGPPGSGKSLLVSLIALQFLKFPGARVIIYDKDRSARSATLANASVEGFVQYYEPGNPDAPLAFQPLRNIDRPGERTWAAEFIVLLLSLQNVKITPAVLAAVDAALEQVAWNPRPMRTMTVFTHALVSHSPALSDALRPYTKAGNYGQIFDAGELAEVDATYARWRMYEMGALMQLGEAAIVPALNYLDHCDAATYDGSPLLKIYDECWLFMSHPIFAAQLRKDLKTLRKKNVSIVFATQEVVDAAANRELQSTIVSACQTKLFAPDASATSPVSAAAYASFGLDAHEIALIARAQPKRDYYYRAASGRRMFTLEPGPAALSIVGAASAADQRDIDKITRTHEPRDYAQALFARRNVEWAVNVMKKETEAADESRTNAEHPTHVQPSTVSASV